MLKLPIHYLKKLPKSSLRNYCAELGVQHNIFNRFKKDDYTNITDRVMYHMNKNLHLKNNHPLSIVRQRIVNYFNKTFVIRNNPVFSVYDQLPPIVTVDQNFDSLLVPTNHPSRNKSDCYYINRNYLLRAHMTAHQMDILKTGLNNFLIIGDVYRRDEIDKTHYPVFHQIDAVRLKDSKDFFPDNDHFQIFEASDDAESIRGQEKQPCHTIEAVKIMEEELKSTLEGLAKSLFGEKIEFQWVDTHFPFTQPSWELEILHNGQWLETLGCGIMKQSILTSAGVTDKIGWAFGLGLERISMCLYKIPDIRLFWSKDSGFLNQFDLDNINSNITYKAVSQFPQCKNDISFWLPESKEFSSNDFYDLVRNVGGDLIEQVKLVDKFVHPKSKKVSHCYRIIYRHMEKTLTQKEVNIVHKEIEKNIRNQLGVTIR
ncbi:probable phenylalanine--tRNA ligase, mitochondrial [Cylas formicarius]|uniref:probable phenylalanine--tRNA ligase, mitochondrial n=1 Tax=Cylas formicarius TaxID=197179 RepID=UPI0029583C53|nr:probable phenylalanine--tRNA ligase, mitochondrial [Cylas formicarius]